MAAPDPPPGPPGWSHVRVPDDARDLHRDQRALERERRASARRRRLGRLLLTRRWERYGLSGPLVVLVLLVVAAFGSLPVLLRPDADPRPEPGPLAAPTTAPGQVGGLLPDGPVQTPAGATTTRELARPGALLLVPVPCRCEDVLADAITQLRPVVGGLRLVSSPTQDPDGEAVRELRTGPERGQVDSGVDTAGTLGRAYAPRGVTLVLVAADGVVVDVVRDLQPRQRLDQALTRLRPLPRR